LITRRTTNREEIATLSLNGCDLNPVLPGTVRWHHVGYFPAGLIARVFIAGCNYPFIRTI
jgi:hypothetical protein